jgi:hypothetical protein
MPTEAQLKHWESLKGKPTWNKGLTKETDERLRSGRMGFYKRTEEQKRKVSEFMKREYAEGRRKGFQKGHSYNKGAIRTKEHREKIRIANLGKHLSGETKSKISSALTKHGKYTARNKIIKLAEKTITRPKTEFCELCGSSKKICFDHDHKTNKFRGWLCGRCNMVLGSVEDNIELLEAMINYLKQSK